MQAVNNKGCSRKRWWLLVSNALQDALVFVAVALQICFPVETSTLAAMCIIALLDFSSGAQVGMVRGLGVTEIKKAVAKSAYVGVVVEKKMQDQFIGNVKGWTFWWR